MRGHWKAVVCGLCVPLLTLIAAGCGSGNSGSTAGVPTLGNSCSNGQKQAAPNVCVNPADSKAGQVADLIARLRTSYKLNASMFGVWEGGDQMVTGALGEALPGVPATRDLNFRICNVTETMTTTLLLEYVDEGRVRLSDPISNWYPSLPRANQITLRMLGTSTSGVADYVTDNDFVDAYHANPFRQWDPQELVNIGFSQPPLFAPGKSWAFSDTNFMLLGEILAKLGGTSVGEELRQKVLDPLGLDHTTMPYSAQIPSPVLHGYDPERGDYQDSTFWNPSWIMYTASMTSNLSDMGKWAQALGTGALLSNSSHQIQVGPGNVGLGPLTSSTYYGMGVGVASGWILSNPHCAGYNGVLAYYPPKKISLVIYSTPGMGNPDTINDSQNMFVAVTKILTPNSVPNLRQRQD